jgi:hypothetical protein
VLSRSCGSANFAKFANIRSKIRAFQAPNRLGKREAIRQQRVQTETRVASKPCRSALHPPHPEARVKMGSATFSTACGGCREDVWPRVSHVVALVRRALRSLSSTSRAHELDESFCVTAATHYISIEMHLFENRIKSLLYLQLFPGCTQS